MGLDVPPEGLPIPPCWLLDMLDVARGPRPRADADGESAAGVDGIIGESKRNDTLTSLAGTMRRRGMTTESIRAACFSENRLRCVPPLSDDEVSRIAESVGRYEPADAGNAASGPVVVPDWFRPLNAPDLIRECPEYRPVVVEGLLREGETINVVAATKVGKSWMVHSLAVAVALGRPWLGHATVGGRVLLIDLELHKETLARRLAAVCKVEGIDPAILDGPLDVRICGQGAGH